MHDKIESAILLVGGFGTRLQPLTLDTPKPMLNIGGVPFTEHQVLMAKDAGIREIVLATAFKSEVFEPYFGKGDRFGISIKYAFEKQPLGTGGAIRNAYSMVTSNGPVAILNGDILSGHSLTNQIALHLETNSEATLYLTEVEDARAFGVVELIGDKIISFNEKMDNPPTNIINAGCYIFNSEIIKTIPENKISSLEREVFPKLIEERRNLRGFVDRSYWLDIGNPKAILRANNDLFAGISHTVAFDKVLTEGNYRLINGSLVSNKAAIDESVIIMPGSFVDHNVIIKENCIIDNSYLAEGVIVESGTRIHSSFVNSKTLVQQATATFNEFIGYH